MLKRTLIGLLLLVSVQSALAEDRKPHHEIVLGTAAVNQGGGLTGGVLQFGDSRTSLGVGVEWHTVFQDLIQLGGQLGYIYTSVKNATDIQNLRALIGPTINLGDLEQAFFLFVGAGISIQDGTTGIDNNIKLAATIEAGKRFPLFGENIVYKPSVFFLTSDFNVNDFGIKFLNISIFY